MSGLTDEVFKKHFDECRFQLYCFVRRFARSDEEAEDITQIALLRGWEKRATFRGDSSVSTWLGSIALNQMKNKIRNDQAKPACSLELFFFLEEPMSDPAELLMAEVYRATVWEAVASLPPSDREIIVQHYFLGWSYKEIDECTGIGIVNIKSRLHRARLRLRQKLQALY